ncbi:TcuA: flavoprotein used to oxidizetricarballylate to cis-aconitate [Salmonella enterica subsp. arizonae]|uniref:TcuA: flavoprotein used to oxidizetricarballylate to cis-aconitate n=1 Tax=Salmonella enterica subsp. arizonae TaxID=59203 RepID=A0A3S5DGC4_SALER|nr:TcuA: flavoprotein used to oxidizetricarballylate to cis-aconitate [Salmonella enterica subsp. arizonae]
MLVERYPEEEFWQDLWRVTDGNTNEALARLVIRTSSQCRDWMRKHGVNFQPPLSGALHVARTNAFFMGGGKALVNAYYRSAERLGVQIRYNTPVHALELHDGEFVAALAATNVLLPKPAYWRLAVSNQIVNGCGRPGEKTRAANGPRIIF